MTVVPADAARSCAVDLMDSVLRRGRPLDDAFADHPGLPRLAARDRAFARNLVATVLRRLGQLDAVINHCLERPLRGKARPARDLLRIGACQLLFIGTPAHAAVATTVDLAEAHGQGPYKKLINAVLRRIDREGHGLAAGQDVARLNTPDWLWQSWTSAHGSATCRRIATAHLAEAPLDLTVRADAADWAGRLGAAVLPTGGLRLRHRGPIADIAGYDAGAWWVQDAAAALPARLLGDVAGQRVYDLCAAPGGKTAQIALAGAHVTAVDRSAKRLGRLGENLARLGLDARTVQADADTWRPVEAADAVLLDAPCSATGTIRRHPDVARLKTPEDVARLAAVQARLLRAAVALVRPGGLLVYSACSLQPEEGPAQVAALIAAGAPVTAEPIRAEEVGGLADLIDDTGALRTLPCHMAAAGGMDGFYAARLRRH